MKLVKPLIFSALALSAYGAANAHHSFAIYDLENAVELTGTLKSFTFRNPHVILALEVEGEAEPILWRVESMAPRRWDSEVAERDIATVGDTVTLKGWPRLNGEPEMALGTVTSPQGKTVVRDFIRQQDGGNRNSSMGGRGR